MAKAELNLKAGGYDSTIHIDGKPVNGVRDVSMSLALGDIPRLTLDVIPQNLVAVVDQLTTASITCNIEEEVQMHLTLVMAARDFSKNQTPENMETLRKVLDGYVE